MQENRTIEDLIKSKIDAVHQAQVNHLNLSLVSKLSEIGISENRLGRILFGIIKLKEDDKITIVTSHCSKYYHFSFCHRDCGNLIFPKNGPTLPLSTDKLFPAADQVSPILLREFEDVDLFCTLSPGAEELHLRIPLLSNSLQTLEKAS